MSTTLIGQYQAATSDLAFVQRVHMAILQTAVNMKDESTTTTNHPNRMVLMKAVTNAPTTYAPIFAFMCASQQNDSASTDATIQSACSAVWNAVAGMP